MDRRVVIWKVTPVINRKYLLLIAGCMWFGVGIMLLRYSVIWLSAYGSGALLFATVGFLTAMAVHHFGFLKVVNKNLKRIELLKEKPCAFSFMSFKSYILVIGMITLGITLRHSSLPKQYLSIIYTGIGLALFLSSIRYFRMFFELGRA